MFLLKKIISPFLLPLSLSLQIAFLGLFLLWFTEKQRAGRILVSFGLCVLTLFSYGAVADQILGPLENRYPPYKLDSSIQGSEYPVRFVVVLGGGHTSDPGLPETSQLSNSSLARLIEGIRIYKKRPQRKLLLSGSGVFDPVSDAQVMAGVAKELGVPEADIIIEGRSKDTKDQAAIIRSMVRNDPFILVTSASHMPRAMALFKKLGLDPIPAPVEHAVKKEQGLSPGSFFPSAGDLHKSERAIYEYLGMAWAKLRKQI